MKDRRISIKGFEKTCKRFEKIALMYLDSPELYDDDAATKERLASELVYNVKIMNQKLVDTYKQSPSKNLSAFTHRVETFQKFDDIVNYIKVSYVFSDDTLTFKLSTKYRRKYKRKVQFKLKIKNDEN